MKTGLSILVFLFSVYHSFAQNDSLPYSVYSDKIVVHTSLSYKDAPFNLKSDFGDFNKLKYRANLNLIHGIGIAYKWFAININYKIPSYLRNRSKYGTTKYFDLGFQFNLKSWYFRVDFHDYIGYGIKNAGIISDTLPLTSSNYYLNDDLQSISIGINAYHFFNHDLRMKAATGIVGRYTEPVHGLYLRLTTNLNAITAPNGLIPYAYLNTDLSIHSATTISSFDFGVIPGYAYINNLDGWQFGVFAGLGALVQVKSFKYANQNRSFLGLSPRIDLKVQMGYNVEKWFLMVTSSVDQKRISFSNLTYNQAYYYVRLTYGYRFTK